MLTLLLLASLSQTPADWPLDELIAANGAKYRGIILDDNAAGVRFRVVQRPVGRPTVTLTTSFLRKEIASLKKISDTDREALKLKLADLDPNGEGARKRMESLELKAADWLGKSNAAKRYDSEQFTLISPSSEEITRRAAVRLEQIFTAYGRFLPARQLGPTRPLTILLAPDKTDYATLLGNTGGPVLNPAIYDITNNRIICGTDLRRIGQELSEAREHNAKQLATLEKYETEIRQLYKDNKTERDRFLATAAEQRRKIRASETANDAEFNKIAAQLLGLLYHEAFHAYITNAVYPPQTADEVRSGRGVGELPRWLNEGFAQIFETAILEGSELRVGSADRIRLERVRALKKAEGLLPLADLLRTGRDAFLTVHQNQKADADRTYLTSWIVGFHLMFERRVLGTQAFETYLKSINSGSEPTKAFELLMGKSIAEYELELASYIDRLRPDGTLP
jgi:hypothetical protein